VVYWTQIEEKDMSIKPKVFITDVNAFDYSPAEAYGELVVLQSQNFASGATGATFSTWNNDVIHSLRHQLLEYVPGRDFIIPTGKPLKMCVVAMIIADRGRRHSFLAWDSMHYRYIPYTLDVGHDG
jgi:hypothetical protein